MWQAMPLSEKKPWKQQANILMEEYQPEIILPRRKPHTMWSAVTKLTDMEVFKDSVDDGMSKTIFYLKSPIKPEEFLYFIHAETSSPINDQESNSPPEVILPHLMGTEMGNDDLAARKMEIKMEQNDESDDLDSRSHDAEPSDMFEDIESMNETLKMEIEIEPNDEFDDKDSSNHDVVEREINIEMKRMSESLSGISRSGRVRKQTIKYEDFEMFESCAKNDTYSVLDHDYCIVQTSKPHTDSHSVKLAKKKKVGKKKEKKPRKKGRPMTAYTLWCRDHRPRVVAENPDLDFSGISVRLGEIWQAIPLSEKKLWKQQANILMKEYKCKIILPRCKPQTMRSAVPKLTEMEVSKDSVDDGMSKTIFSLKSPIKPEEFSYFIDAETSSTINDQESNSPPEVILPHLMDTEMGNDDLAAREREIKIEPNDEFDDEDSSSHDVVKREINIDSMTLDDGGIPEKERVNKRPSIAAGNPDMNFYEINRLVDERHQRKKMGEEKMCWRRQEKLLETSTPPSVSPAEKNKVEKQKKKRPVTTYALWCRDQRPQLVAKHPGICGNEITGRLGKLWRGLPDKEKMFWHKQREQIVAKILENSETTEISEEAQPAENTETSEETQPAETSGETQPSTVFYSVYPETYTNANRSYPKKYSYPDKKYRYF